MQVKKEDMQEVLKNVDAIESLIYKNDIYLNDLFKSNIFQMIDNIHKKIDLQLMKEEKKKYLQDLKLEEVKKIIENNDNFIYNFYQLYYDIMMNMQDEEIKSILGENFHEYILIKDHYNSFYLRIKDYYKFIKNIDIDYLSPEQISIYNKIIINDLEEIEESEEIIKLCDDLLNLIENDLHSYENIEKNDLINFILDNEYYINFYYLDDNKNILYQENLKINSF